MTDLNPTYKPPFQKPQSEKRMSGCAKAALGVSILGILALSACCIGGVLFVRQSITNDPDRIREIGSRMLTWDALDQFQPLAGGEFWAFRFVLYGNQQVEMVMWGDSRFFETNADQDEFQGGQFRGDFSGQNFEETHVIDDGERKFTIKGVEVTLNFDRTKGRNSGNLYWELAGIVPGNQRPVLLYLRLLQSTHSEQQVIDLINSIR